MTAVANRIERTLTAKTRTAAKSGVRILEPGAANDGSPPSYVGPASPEVLGR